MTLWVTIIGLGLASAAVAKTKLLEGVRAWLLGFRLDTNPLKLLGQGLGCPLCVGFWVGFAAGSGALDRVVMGGWVAGAAALAGFLLWLSEFAAAKDERIDPDVAKAVPLLAAQLEMMQKKVEDLE